MYAGSETVLRALAPIDQLPANGWMFQPKDYVIYKVMFNLKNLV